MRRLLFAANWKMHHGPDAARDYARRFREGFVPSDDRDTWFFPPAVSLEATAAVFSGLPGTRIGAQDIHWEPKGAFTGAISAPLAKSAGATTTLIGHSERRHRFGETEEETGRKLRAALAEGLIPVLCLGEKLEQRERGETMPVVHRQLMTATQGLEGPALDQLVIAYEPVWAIGTGRNATPSDAAQVHAGLRSALRGLGAQLTRVLYGGSVNAGNAAELLAEPEVDGVLVGGASLDPEGWTRICRLPVG